MDNKMEFKDKRILITGGSRGIGKAISVALCELQAKVTVLGRSSANLQSLKKELPSIETLCVDISDWDATRKSLQNKSFDILINNAGVLVSESFLDVTSSSFDTVMSTNLKSVFNVSQVVAEDMIKRKQGGAVVNMSSLTSKRILSFAASYSCSKAALDMLTKIMANELGPHGIRVNSVNPGVVITDLVTDSIKAAVEKGVNPHELSEKLTSRIPLEGNGPTVSTDTVVDAVLFLASSKSKCTTGQHLVIDNGYMAT